MNFRWINSGEGHPAVNMAVDQVLFEESGIVPTFRVYGWESAAVSLGRFQDEQSIPGYLKGYPWVKRMTGGGAVLHRNELTYSVATPYGQSWSYGLLESYEQINLLLRVALTSLGVEFDVLPSAFEVSRHVEGDSFLCFERRSGCCDLTVKGRKLVGSAQRRGKSGILQHGSIPLGPAANSPGSVTLSEVLGREITFECVATALQCYFSEVMGGNLHEGRLTLEELSRQRELLVDRYRIHKACALA